jgi:hypothetical protein
MAIAGSLLRCYYPGSEIEIIDNPFMMQRNRRLRPVFPLSLPAGKQLAISLLDFTSGASAAL